jgi:hypothetical protein
MQTTFATLGLLPQRKIWEESMAPHEQHAVEIIWDRKWVVLVTAYGNTIPFPFESEDYARSYAAGQAFRLGVEVIEMRKCA